MAVAALVAMADEADAWRYEQEAGATVGHDGTRIVVLDYGAPENAPRDRGWVWTPDMALDAPVDRFSTQTLDPLDLRRYEGPGGEGSGVVRGREFGPVVHAPLPKSTEQAESRQDLLRTVREATGFFGEKTPIFLEGDAADYFFKAATLIAKGVRVYLEGKQTAEVVVASLNDRYTQTVKLADQMDQLSLHMNYTAARLDGVVEAARAQVIAYERSETSETNVVNTAAINYYFTTAQLTDALELPKMLALVTENEDQAAALEQIKTNIQQTAGFKERFPDLTVFAGALDVLLRADTADFLADHNEVAGGLAIRMEQGRVDILDLYARHVDEAEELYKAQTKGWPRSARQKKRGKTKWVAIRKLIAAVMELAKKRISALQKRSAATAPTAATTVTAARAAIADNYGKLSPAVQQEVYNYSKVHPNATLLRPEAPASSPRSSTPPLIVAKPLPADVPALDPYVEIKSTEIDLLMAKVATSTHLFGAEVPSLVKGDDLGVYRKEALPVVQMFTRYATGDATVPETMQQMDIIEKALITREELLLSLIYLLLHTTEELDKNVTAALQRMQHPMTLQDGAEALRHAGNRFLTAQMRRVDYSVIPEILHLMLADDHTKELFNKVRPRMETTEAFSEKHAGLKRYMAAAHKDHMMHLLLDLESYQEKMYVQAQIFADPHRRHALEEYAKAVERTQQELDAVKPQLTEAERGTLARLPLAYSLDDIKKTQTQVQTTLTEIEKLERASEERKEKIEEEIDALQTELLTAKRRVDRFYLTRIETYETEMHAAAGVLNGEAVAADDASETASVVVAASLFAAPQPHPAVTQLHADVKGTSSARQRDLLFKSVQSGAYWAGKDVTDDVREQAWRSVQVYLLD